MPRFLGWLQLLRGLDRPGAGSFTPRVIAVILIILLIFLAWTFYWLLDEQRQSLYDEKRLSLRDNVQLALSLCSKLEADAQSGLLAEEDAREQAQQLLGSMRYGQMNGSYFFVLDTSGRLLYHPLRPDVHAVAPSLGAQETENRLLHQIAQAASANPIGSSTYAHKWAGGGPPEQKIAAYGRFEPWNWIIVTESMTAEIDARIARELGRQLLVLVLLTIVLALVLSTTLKRLVLNGVERMIEIAGRLRAGDLTARIQASPTDEMSTLARSFNEMAEGIQLRDERIRNVTRTSVFALAKLAEARDRETGGHLLRVREYSAILCSYLRKNPKWRDLIDQKFIADIYDAVMLHDIGKVAIPDSILLKPDVLDDGERAIMMSHTLVGANTIRMARERMKVQSGFLEMAEQIARSHHERWDGDGYVECLKGDQIPLAARIFTMADIYDALTTERAYKAAFTHEEAVEAMREDRGRRFDPDVFDAFLEAGAEFNKVRQQFADE